jgi:hypothetical protein
VQPELSPKAEGVTEANEERKQRRQQRIAEGLREIFPES